MVHDRGPERARMLVLAAGVAALTLLGKPPAVYPKDSHYAAGHTGGQTRQPPPKSAHPSQTPTFQSDAQRIASAREEANRYTQTPEQQRDSADALKAEKDTARWAAWMLVVAGAETFITGAGVLLVALTLNAARRSAEAAEKTLAHASDATRRELRAYISVAPVGVKTLIGREKTIGQVDVRNVGKLPAHRVLVTVHMEMDDNKERNEFLVPEAGLVERTVQPGENLIQGSKDYVDHSTIVTNPKKYIFVWGIVWYDDGFEKRRFTRFSHRYNVARRSPDGNWQSGSIQVHSPEKARYHTRGNDAD